MHPKWKEYSCPICGEKGHPPYAKYSKAVSAIAKGPDLLSKIKKTFKGSSEESGDSSEKLKSHKTSKNKKKESKKEARNPSSLLPSRRNKTSTSHR